MSFFSAFVVFLITWWLVLFTVLPWGNDPPKDLGEGHAGSAPANPRLKQKFLITTVIAACISLIIYGLIRLDLVDFHEIARQMVAEDNSAL